MAVALSSLRPVMLMILNSLVFTGVFSGFITSALSVVLLVAMPAASADVQSQDLPFPSPAFCPIGPVFGQFQSYFDRRRDRYPTQYQRVDQVAYIDSLALNESKKVNVYRHDAFVNNIFLGPIDVFSAQTTDKYGKTRYYALVVFNNGCALLDMYEVEVVQ